MRYNINRQGREGEDFAAAMLQEKGYSILARNFRSRWGEVDIVALKEDLVVFVEVKSWEAYTREDLRFSINEKKRARIEDAALFFSSQASGVYRLSN